MDQFKDLENDLRESETEREWTKEQYCTCEKCKEYDRFCESVVEDMGLDEKSMDLLGYLAIFSMVIVGFVIGFITACIISLAIFT